MGDVLRFTDSGKSRGRFITMTLTLYILMSCGRLSIQTSRDLQNNLQIRIFHGTEWHPSKLICLIGINRDCLIVQKKKFCSPTVKCQECTVIQKLGKQLLLGEKFPELNGLSNTIKAENLFSVFSIPFC